MKLTPLSDFVLEQKETSTIDTAQIDWYDKEISKLDLIRSYTKFLKQPLTLGMFVPVNKDGVLLKPLQFCCSSSDCGCMGMPVNVSCQEEIDEYYEAKEKVLFEGWTHEDRYGWVQHHELGLEINTETGTLAIFHENGIGYGYVKKVEDLVSYALTLTPSALEVIGMKE
ncbi:hypothetical protein [Chryseobacterium sp.]|uniref:hypothetical protein n=1 Tax=Chryseobacterium sp. TaxID=1871047 RepID=UPI0031D8CE53